MAMIAKKTKVEKEPNLTSKLVTKIAVNPKTSSKAISTASVGLISVKQDDDIGKAFNLPYNSDLLSQYIRFYQFGQRKGNAKVKTRGEVAGSGRKPWKQKHTGRARVGSVRNPVWRHGGVSHGPVLKDWSIAFPKKMKSAAFAVALSQKVQNSQVFLIDKIELSEGRTKEMLGLLKGWNLAGSVLVITENVNPHLSLASANLQNIEIAVWTNLNTYQLIANTNILFEKTALEKIKEKYAKN